MNGFAHNHCNCPQRRIVNRQVCYSAILAVALVVCVCVSETPTILDGISFNGKHLGFKVLTGRPITSKNLVLRYRLLNVEKYRIPLAKVLTCFNHQKLEVNKQAWDFHRQNSRYCLYKCRLAFGNYHKGWDAM